MTKGLPKSIIKKYGISKKAWRIFRGQKSSKSSNPSPSKKARKVRRKVAKKRRSRRSGGMTVPLAPMAGLAAGLARPAQELMAGNIDGAVTHLLYNYTGLSGYPGNLTFKMEGLKNGVMPLVTGLLVHKFVGGPPLNLNRILARAKVPFIRI